MKDPNDECQCDDCLWAEDYFADLARKEKKEREIWEPGYNDAMEAAIEAMRIAVKDDIR